MMTRIPDLEGMPFAVEPTSSMVLSIRGVRPDTVLTLEQNLYGYKVCEYVEPLFYERQWCYSTVEEAVVALLTYCLDADADEPLGWTRALVLGQPPRYGRCGDGGGD